jgi:MFS family permease
VGLAQGIQSASAAAGGTCLSLITPKLFEAVGTRATLAIFAGIGVFIGIIVSILAQAPRKFEKRSIHVIGWKDFQKAEFTLLLLVNLVNPLTIAIPMTFGPDFSKALGFEMQMATILLAVNSAVGIPTRLANGYIADYIGHQNILLLSTALYMLGTWALWLTAAQTSNGTIWIAFTVIHGVFNGTFITVINSIQKHLFGAELYYPYNGAMTSMKGIGYVAGIPIAGHLVNRDKKDSDLKGEDFTKAIYYAGVVLAFNVLCQIGVRVVDGRKHGWKWKR